MNNIHSIAKRAQDAARSISVISTEKKNSVLKRMMELIDSHRDKIIQVNEADMDKAIAKGLSENLVRRLAFTEEKISGRIRSLEKIMTLPDPVGQIDELEKRPNGLMVGRMRVPIGVIFMIYEARPHVTVNAGAFALKSGNAIILKGGFESRGTNTLLGNLWHEALNSEGLAGESIQCITASHEEVSEMLCLSEYIDLVIPRGGKRLIEAVSLQSRIPVIKHFEGMCHIYIDDQADMEKAVRITLNSKLLMPEVCNAVETLLVSEARSKDVLYIVDSLEKHGVEVRGCERVQELIDGIIPCMEQDWRTEYLDRIISVKIVRGIEEAIDHINKYGSGHTDAIVTENHTTAMRFLKEVDSAVVLLNASTMFNDGEELGMGAEIGISTDKLHARGPMGLRELTTYKFIVLGEGHVKEA